MDSNLEADLSLFCDEAQEFLESGFHEYNAWLKTGSLIIRSIARFYQKAVNNLLQDIAKAAIFGNTDVKEDEAFLDDEQKHINKEKKIEIEDEELSFSEFETDHEIKENIDSPKNAEFNFNIEQNKNEEKNDNRKRNIHEIIEFESKDEKGTNNSLKKVEFNSNKVKDSKYKENYDNEDHSLNEFEERFENEDEEDHEEDYGSYGSYYVTIRKRPKLVDYADSDTFTDDESASVGKKSLILMHLKK